MLGLRRLAVSEVGEVTVVRFMDRRILDEANIQEIGWDLFQLVDGDDRKRLLLNFADVEFLASSGLGKLITLYHKLKARGGALKFCNVSPGVYDVFAVTRLNELFDIHDEEAEALASFG